MRIIAMDIDWQSSTSSNADILATATVALGRAICLRLGMPKNVHPDVRAITSAIMLIRACFCTCFNYHSTSTCLRWVLQ